MEWLFGKRLTPEEMLRRNQRSLNKAIRDLDRERMKMEQQEKKIIADIKKMAKDNQMVKISTKFVFQLSYKSKLLCSLQFCSYFTVDLR
jgi:charged multivesicular body protein 2A